MDFSLSEQAETKLVNAILASLETSLVSPLQKWYVECRDDGSLRSEVNYTITSLIYMELAVRISKNPRVYEFVKDGQFDEGFMNQLLRMIPLDRTKNDDVIQSILDEIREYFTRKGKLHPDWGRVINADEGNITLQSNVLIPSEENKVKITVERS